MPNKWSKYAKKYNSDWESESEFSGWLMRTPEKLINEGKSEAYCKLCKRTIRPQKNDLREHAKTATHKAAVKALPGKETGQRKLEGCGFAPVLNRAQKEVDCKLAAHVASNSSTRTVDHLSGVLKDVGKGSKLEDLRLHRTKCSRIIVKVVAPAQFEELIEDIGDSEFSVICDEATDNTAKKQFALCVVYLSKKQKRIVTAFLGIVETPKATAELLYSAFVKFFEETCRLNLTKLVALGTDGANALCGQFHSLFALLKLRKCPTLQLIRCLCHSLHRCASAASKQIPSSVEHLIRESRNWFVYSSVRKLEYSNLYESLHRCQPPLLVQIGDTRFLSYYGAVKAHLEQYPTLKTHFNTIASSKDACPTSTKLAELHNDNANLLYLTFLSPVLKEVTETNLLFQSTKADVTKAYKDLRTFVLSLANRILKPHALGRQQVSSQPGILRLDELEMLKAALSKEENLKPLDLVTFGSKFRSLAMTLEAERSISPDALKVVKSKCAQFLLTLLKEICRLLPSSITAVQKFSTLAPSAVLASRGRPEFHELPFEILPSTVDEDILESQWNYLGALNLQEAESVDEVTTEEFWIGCFKLKNAAGENVLKEIAEKVLALLSFPLSNAFVERVFSIMAIIKTKQRNKLSTRMLNALLFIRLYLLHVKQTCCQKFEETEKMFERFTSSVMCTYDEPKSKRPRLEHAAEEAIVEEEGLLVDENGNTADKETIEFDEDAIDEVLTLIEELDSNGMFKDLL